MLSDLQLPSLNLGLVRSNDLESEGSGTGDESGYGESSTTSTHSNTSWEGVDSDDNIKGRRGALLSPKSTENGLHDSKNGIKTKKTPLPSRGRTETDPTFLSSSPIVMSDLIKTRTGRSLSPTPFASTTKSACDDVDDLHKPHNFSCDPSPADLMSDLKNPSSDSTHNSKGKAPRNSALVRRPSVPLGSQPNNAALRIISTSSENLHTVVSSCTTRSWANTPTTSSLPTTPKLLEEDVHNDRLLKFGDRRKRKEKQPLSESSPQKPRRRTKEKELVNEKIDNRSSGSTSDSESGSNDTDESSFYERPYKPSLSTQSSFSAPSSVCGSKKASSSSIPVRQRGLSSDSSMHPVSRSPEGKIELASDGEGDDFSAGSNDERVMAEHAKKEAAAKKEKLPSSRRLETDSPGRRKPPSRTPVGFNSPLLGRKGPKNGSTGNAPRPILYESSPTAQLPKYDANLLANFGPFRNTQSPLASRKDPRAIYARMVGNPMQSSFDVGHVRPAGSSKKGMGWEEASQSSASSPVTERRSAVAAAVDAQLASMPYKSPRDRKRTLEALKSGKSRFKLRRSASLTILEPYLNCFETKKLIPVRQKKNPYFTNASKHNSHMRRGDQQHSHHKRSPSNSKNETDKAKDKQKAPSSDKSHRRYHSRTGGLSKSKMSSHGEDADPWLLLMNNDQLFLTELFSPNMRLLSMLCAAVESNDELDMLCPAFVRLFEANGTGIQLMQWAIRTEVEKTNERHSLFREDKLSAKFIGAYATYLCHDYLVATLRPAIRKMCSTKQSYELDSRHLKSEKSEKERQQNFKRLRKLCQAIVDAVIASRPLCPVPIEQLAYSLNEEVNRKFESAGEGCVSSFIFLRFFLPAVVAPDVQGIVKNPPTDEARRALILVSKTLQTMANNLRFEDNQAHLLPLNEFIDSNQRNMMEFLHSLIVPTSARGAGSGIRRPSDPDVSIAQASSPNGEAVVGGGLNLSKLEDIVENEAAALQRLREFCTKNRKRFVFSSSSERKGERDG
eukprot:TRINITY_DN2423_c0_g1_i1.p1 TRINITY_DN2423_c0_g1~~TRINITY_DN2423_c0_g1_i1.p1  ORF type:complete len:1012 (-),score=151.84 TRINITY_DN2423_c0_g1_i1:143-3178(-)